MMAEMDDDAVYVVVIAVVALTAGTLNRFDEASAVATNYSQDWNDLQEIRLLG